MRKTLMALLPQSKNTTEYRIESIKHGGNPRDYLGMSGVGAECLRQQWYAWRWTVLGTITARVNRIFRRGHSEESSIISDLTEIGCKVFRVKDNKEIVLTGAVKEEQEELISCHGHSKGHPDGRVRGIIEAPKTVHLLEMKTMKDSKFQTIKAQGLRRAFPTYYDQMSIYMGKMKLARGFFVSTNKDNQARHYERIKFNKKRFEELERKQEEIVLSESPPKKQYNPDNYLCNWCSYSQVCHFGAVPNVSCRSCVHCDLLPAGKWKCNNPLSTLFKRETLSYRRQLKGCKKYKRLY